METDEFRRFQWIGDIAPCFPVRGEQIRILRNPQEFYETLKVLSRNSKVRILIASYYLGTGKLEKELLDCIYDAVKTSEEEGGVLQVRFLFDYLRGSRGDRNSRTMVLPLLRDFGGRVSAAVYHTPDVHGLAKILLPRWYKESIGAFHMKVYLFDDTLIMTGANISEPYFIDRQDRYVVIDRCPTLSDFFEEMTTVVSSLSFQLQSDDLCCSHHLNESDGGDIYKKEMKQKIEQVISNRLTNPLLCQPKIPVNGSSAKGQHSDACAEETDTLIYPLLQMAPFGVRQEEAVMKTLFEKSPSDVTMHLASPYFNPTDQFINSILNAFRGHFHILTSSPQSNCFCGVPGFLGFVPVVYSSIVSRFVNRVSCVEQNERISVNEYHRPGWTNHAKGLWYYPASSDHSHPVMTIVGSSNFGYRSVFRDLEAEVIIVTQNKMLQTQLHEEQLRLYSHSRPATCETFRQPQRKISQLISNITPIIQTYF